jgi:hypothetical protein
LNPDTQVVQAPGAHGTGDISDNFYAVTIAANGDTPNTTMACLRGKFDRLVFFWREIVLGFLCLSVLVAAVLWVIAWLRSRIARLGGRHLERSDQGHLSSPKRTSHDRPVAAVAFRTALLGAVLVGVIGAHNVCFGDEVDTAVDAVVVAGGIAGVPIGQTDARVLKSLLRCHANNTPMPVCAVNEVIGTLPPEVRPVVSCLASGQEPTRCATQQVLANLPSGSREVAECVAKRADFASCGAAVATSTPTRSALGLFDRLSADNRNGLASATQGPLRHLLGLVEGIREDDWEKVFTHGGVVAYQTAAKVVLRVVLPPVFPPPLDIAPIVDAIVQSRADLATRVIRAVRRHDLRAAGSAVTEAYLLQFVLAPCAISGIPRDLHEATCGNLGKVIHSIASVGGDIAKLPLDVLKDPLGVPANVWRELEGVRGTIAGKSSNCAPPEARYATTYTPFYHRAAYLRFTGGRSRLEQLAATPNNMCRQYYDQCFFSHHFDRLCNPLTAKFIEHAEAANAAAKQTAQIYVRSYADFRRSRGAAECKTTGLQAHTAFMQGCRDTLARQIPLTGSPERDDGRPTPIGRWTHTLHSEACAAAIKTIRTDEITRKICREFPEDAPIEPRPPAVRPTNPPQPPPWGPGLPGGGRPLPTELQK